MALIDAIEYPRPSKDLFLRKLGFPRAKGQKSNLQIAAYCLLFSPPMEVSEESPNSSGFNL